MCKVGYCRDENSHRHQCICECVWRVGGVWSGWGGVCGVCACVCVQTLKNQLCLNYTTACIKPLGQHAIVSCPEFTIRAFSRNAIVYNYSDGLTSPTATNTVRKATTRVLALFSPLPITGDDGAPPYHA